MLNDYYYYHDYFFFKTAKTSTLEILYFSLVSTSDILIPPENQSAVIILYSVRVYNTIEHVIKLNTVIYKRRN